MAARATSAVVARWLGVAGDGRARQSFRPVRDERPEWLPAYRRSVRGGEGAVAVVGTVVAVGAQLKLAQGCLRAGGENKGPMGLSSHTYKLVVLVGFQ